MITLAVIAEVVGENDPTWTGLVELFLLAMRLVWPVLARLRVLVLMPVRVSCIPVPVRVAVSLPLPVPVPVLTTTTTPNCHYDSHND